MTTTTTRTRLTLFGDRPARNQDHSVLEAAPTSTTKPMVSDDAIAAIRASFSEKRFKARRSVHHVS